MAQLTVTPVKNVANLSLCIHYIYYIVRDINYYCFSDFKRDLYTNNAVCKIISILSKLIIILVNHFHDCNNYINIGC